MSFQIFEPTPDDPERLPPARRRRARRLLAPLDADERADFISALASRAAPSFDFFLLSLIAGVVLAVGLRLDAPALLVLGAALAPLMAPAVGVALGTVVGANKLFMRSLGGLLVGCLLVFLVGLLAGRLSPQAADLALLQAPLHVRLSWFNFLTLAVGAVLTTAAVVQSENNDTRLLLSFPNVAWAYALYLPLAAAGFGLGAGIPHLWPDGLVIFALHLAWSILFGALTLALMGFRPLTLFGYTLGGVMALSAVVLFIGLSGISAVVTAGVGLPTRTPTLTPSLTPSLTPTLTPVPPTATLTPSLTPTLTFTPTPSLTPTATPVFALVRGAEGVRIRREPGGETLGFLSNDSLVVVLPETQVVDGQGWVHIRSAEGIDGWILQVLLQLVTPTPAS